MPVNPEVLREIIRRFGKSAVKAAMTKVQVPNMTGTATAAATSLRDIPKTESTVGKEALVAGTALASPLIVSNPGVQKFASTMLRDLPAFEAIDRLPEVASHYTDGASESVLGQGRVSEQGADVLESAYRFVIPNGRFEERTAPFVHGAGQALSMLPVGGLSEAAMRGLDSAVGRRVSKSLEHAARKEYEKSLKTGYDAGLNHVSNSYYGTTNKNPIFGNGKHDLYYKDGFWYPVEGADTAGSASLGYKIGKIQLDSKAWENWMDGHGYSGFKNAKDAFPYAWATPEGHKLFKSYLGNNKNTVQNYWTSLAELNKELKNSAEKNLSFDSDIDKLISDLDLSVENITVDKDVQDALAKVMGKAKQKPSPAISPDPHELDDEFFKGLNYTPPKPPPAPAAPPVFEEHGPWEQQHPYVYTGISGVERGTGNTAVVRPKVAITNTPVNQEVDAIIRAVHEGRMEPFDKTLTDMFGEQFTLPEYHAALRRTSRWNEVYPNDVDYWWRAKGADSGRAPGPEGFPQWATYQSPNYYGYFGGSHNMAARGYAGGSFSGLVDPKQALYSMDGGSPNMMLLYTPKGKIYDTGVDLQGMNWTQMFDYDKPEIFELMKKFRDGTISRDEQILYNKLTYENPFKLRGVQMTRRAYPPRHGGGDTDVIDAFLEHPDANGFGYAGVHLRGLQDGDLGSEIIWNPSKGGYPKIVHPASTGELLLNVNNLLRRSGGPIHIKPENRGKFTALMKRTGKPASWFKAHGTPAQKKMATFALNARKWKHADGGLLDVYDEGTMLQYPDGGRIRGRRNGKYFVTELGNKKEQQFQDWYAETAANLGLDPNPDAYEQAYDYRGYWLNNRDADISSPDFHFPDTWKQPQHPTFSNESVYAKGIDGVGHWDGDKFIPGYFNNVMMATAPKRPAVVEEAPSSPYAPSEDILNYIKDIESFRDQWYQDGNGVWTIGYGFTGDDVRRRFPNGMTRAEADQYFADTVSRRVPQFISATPNFDKLNQNQRDALFSYYYNIGHGGYTRKSPTMQKALTDFDLDTVRENIDFGYNDKKNRGLRKRRDYERNLFATPMDYGGILNRLRSVYGDNESIKAAILRAKNVKK